MEDLLKAFYGYWYDAKLLAPHFWAYPLAALALVWLLTIVLSKTIIKPSIDNTFKKVFYIYKAALWATFITMGLLIFGVFYWWSKGLYGKQSFEFSHLLTFILLWALAIFIIVQSSNFYKKSQLKEIINQPISPNNQNNQSLEARKGFFKNRWAVIAGLLGFSGALLLYLRPISLISIVIDDSGSMGPALENGKMALGETFKNFSPKYTKIVISNYGDKNVKQDGPYKNFEQLSKVKDPNVLDAHTLICNGIDDANNFINGLSATKGYGLNHAIWQNYLTTQRIYKENPMYGDRVLLVISDGIEYDRRWYNSTLCDQATEIDPFYNGNIHWIDLQDRSQTIAPEQNGFYAMMQECYPANIYQGLSMDDYTVAVQTVLNEFELDYRLIWWLAILFGIGTIIMFLIPPKPINTK